jgi:O-antigen/teichoic acid export membrane protein
VRRFWFSIASTSIVRVYALAASLLSVMITARWLGPGGQGIVAAATTWATLFGTLGSLSLGQVAIHRATAKRDEPWLGDTLGTLVALAAVISIGCWSVAFILDRVTGGKIFAHLSPRTIVLAFLLVPFVVWEFYGSNLLMAVDKVVVYNKAQLAGRTIGLVLMLICWFLRLPVDAAIVIAVVSQMAVAVLGMRELFGQAAGSVRARLGVAKEMVVGGLKLHMNAVGSFVFIWMAVLLVNQFRGPVQTGLYQFASSLLNVLLVIPTAASLVLSARVANEGPTRAWTYHRRVMMYMTLAMIAVGAIAAAAAPVAVRIVVGPKYAPAVPLFQLLTISLIGQTFGAIMGSQWIGRGLFWQMSALTLFTSALHAAMSFLWIPRYGMYGAVYASLLTSGISIIGNGTFALLCEIEYRRFVREQALAAPLEMSA